MAKGGSNDLTANTPVKLTNSISALNKTLKNLVTTKGDPIRPKSGMPSVATGARQQNPPLQTHKLYTCVLMSGEIILYVCDRFNPKKPAFTVNSFRLLDDEEMKSRIFVADKIKQRSKSNPASHFFHVERANARRGALELPWTFLVRKPKDGQVFTVQHANAWGARVTSYIQMVESKADEGRDTSSAGSPARLLRNEYEYAGDLTEKLGTLDQAYAGSFFTLEDIMYTLIMPRLPSVMTPADICSNTEIMEAYYGPRLVETAKAVWVKLADVTDVAGTEEHSVVPDEGENPYQDLLNAFALSKDD